MKTILIVEDEVDIAVVLRDLLELYGYRVEVAHDGQEGLAKAQASKPDLVVTDMMLPRLDGAELIERLRERPETRDVPILAISAAIETTHRPFLSKPFELKDFLDMVRGLLEGTAEGGRGGQSSKGGSSGSSRK